MLGDLRVAMLGDFSPPGPGGRLPQGGTPQVLLLLLGLTLLATSLMIRLSGKRGVLRGHDR